MDTDRRTVWNQNVFVIRYDVYITWQEIELLAADKSVFDVFLSKL